jgi:hypothetical protein
VDGAFSQTTVIAKSDGDNKERNLHMAVPGYILVPGSTKLTETPYYVGHVQHESVMNTKEAQAYLSQKLGFSEANIHAALRAASVVICSAALKGQSTTIDNVVAIRPNVKGSFAGSNGPWVKGTNYITLNAVELDAFKNALRGIVPLCKASGITPVIKSVLDNVTGVYDVIAGTNAFTVAGTDLAPDKTRTDEYVGIISADGTLTKAEIASSDLNTVKAAFSSAPKAGEYTLVIATRSGLGDDVGVKTVTRKVAIG